MIRGSRITAENIRTAYKEAVGKCNAQNIRTAYKEAVGKCNALLEELLLGLKPLLKLDLVHEDFAEALVGFQFMAKKDQSQNEAICSTLLLHVLSTRSLRQRFVVTIEGRKIHFNPSEGNRYLDLYNEHLENLLLIIHIGSAWATELETYTVCNGRTSMWSVYFLRERIFFHSVYSKTRSVTGTNKGITRFLNKDASQTVITDLIFVRPFASVVTNFLWLNEDKRIHHSSCKAVVCCTLLPSVTSLVACFTNTPKRQLHSATSGKRLPTLLGSSTYAAATMTPIQTTTSLHPISRWPNLATVLQWQTYTTAGTVESIQS